MVTAFSNLAPVQHARARYVEAMVLECMRQAKSQQRQCYLYSFSGPGDCQELELKVTGKGRGGPVHAHTPPQLKPP